MVVVFGPKYFASLYQYTCGPIFAAVLTHSLKYTSCCTRHFLFIAVAVINSEKYAEKVGELKYPKSCIIRHKP